MLTNHAVSRRVVDRTVGNVRIVSEVSYDGRCIEVPDDAVDVRVQPLNQYGATRVTYRQPLREVTIDEPRAGTSYVY